MMKKALICVVALAVFVFLQFSMALAKVVVEKPDLPQGYESWPHTYKGVCANNKGESLNVSIFARIHGDPKSLEDIVVLNFSARSTYLHTHTRSVGELLVILYESNETGTWNKLDSANIDDRKEIYDFLDLVDIALAVLCPSVGPETSNFYEKLMKQLAD